MHQDGDGYNVVLQALPIDGKIVLRLPKDDQADQPAQEANPTNQIRLSTPVAAAQSREQTKSRRHARRLFIYASRRAEAWNEPAAIVRRLLPTPMDTQWLPYP